MTSRRFIDAAVAAACSVLSVTATAQTTRQPEASSTNQPVMVQEVITPFSVSESGPSWPMLDTRARPTLERSATYVSLPNPQTPFSPNESGPVNYAQEMRERAQHVASVAEARTMVARIETERLAAIERERVEAIERERLAALERERLANAQTSPTSDATISSAPVGTTSAAAGGTSAAVTSPVESGLTTAPVPAPVPQREAQADPNAALVNTRSALGSSTAPQDNSAAGASPAHSSSGASAEARQPDATAETAGLSGDSGSIGGTSSTMAGGGTARDVTPRENNQLMLHGGNADSTPR